MKKKRTPAVPVSQHEQASKRTREQENKKQEKKQKQPSIRNLLRILNIIAGSPHPPLAIPVRFHTSTSPTASAWPSNSQVHIRKRERERKFTNSCSCLGNNASPTKKPLSLLLPKAHRLLDGNRQLPLQHLEVLIRREVEPVETSSSLLATQFIPRAPFRHSSNFQL